MTISRSTNILFALVATLSLTWLTGCDSSPDANSPAAINLAKGKKFMEENAKKEGVITLDNGIQYKVLTDGSGKNPKLTDIVLVHSRGMHLDGSVFSDSYADGKPEEVLVKFAIPGWKKTLPLMSVGSKWKLWLPQKMGFSNRGYENIIEPNETLVYELEVVEVKW